MYTEPEIIVTKKLNIRAYIKTYINGKRFRLYNGRTLGIKCNPNYAQSLQDRKKMLDYLCYQLKKKLDTGWHPWMKKEKPIEVKIVTVKDALRMLPQLLKTEKLSEHYEGNLGDIYHKFWNYARTTPLGEMNILEVKASHLLAFLHKYKTSGTNYMNKRAALGALFKRFIDLQIIEDNPVHKAPRMKRVVERNVPFTKEQLKKVLEVIKKEHEDVYLCCLFMYGCLLRPHTEIRQLRKKSFDDFFTKITLGGKENKSRKIRTVQIPEYVRSILLQLHLDELNVDDNIFSRTNEPFNQYYFHTAWSRIKTRLVKDKVISKEHTFYSFRHTAAVNMYLKTKDPYKIQQAFGHSSLNVTLTYLRNLGMMTNASLDDLPDL
ncbi:MAG: tyrosine-type recombinase/integrase [Bacteroidetes bacterium]|nr:tyrosine-type recombinase/integrase [Bacteroidota bacterium]